MISGMTGIVIHNRQNNKLKSCHFFVDLVRNLSQAINWTELILAPAIQFHSYKCNKGVSIDAKWTIYSKYRYASIEFTGIQWALGTLLSSWKARQGTDAWTKWIITVEAYTSKTPEIRGFRRRLNSEYLFLITIYIF